jgi:hypothetical protein
MTRKINNSFLQLATGNALAQTPTPIAHLSLLLNSGKSVVTLWEKKPRIFNNTNTYFKQQTGSRKQKFVFTYVSQTLVCEPLYMKCFWGVCLKK